MAKMSKEEYEEWWDSLSIDERYAHKAKRAKKRRSHVSARRVKKASEGRNVAVKLEPKPKAVSKAKPVKYNAFEGRYVVGQGIPTKTTSYAKADRKVVGTTIVSVLVPCKKTLANGLKDVKYVNVEVPKYATSKPGTVATSRNHNGELHSGPRIRVTDRKTISLGNAVRRADQMLHREANTKRFAEYSPTLPPKFRCLGKPRKPLESPYDEVKAKASSNAAANRKAYRKWAKSERKLAVLAKLDKAA